MATNNKPANTLRCGNIKATIWQKVSERSPFFSTTFSRPFKDQSGGWHNGTSFGLNDLEAPQRHYQSLSVWYWKSKAHPEKRRFLLCGNCSTAGMGAYISPERAVHRSR